MAGVGWLNFFFLGAGGSGMPYFSLLSAALSLYFSYSPEKKKKKKKTFWILECSHINYGNNVTPWGGEWFCIEPNLSLFSLQLLQLCFSHFGSAENLQVFLEKTSDKYLNN